MMRAACDAVTGAAVIAVHRDPSPPVASVELAAADAGWGIVRAHLERAGIRHGKQNPTWVSRSGIE